MTDEEKTELTELYENSEWWHNRFNAVQRDYENLQTKIDKAIEYIKKEYKFIDLNTGEITYTKGGKDLLEILGDKENDK